jgi:NAD(P)H dehydrogenase (quinone)
MHQTSASSRGLTFALVALSLAGTASGQAPPTASSRPVPASVTLLVAYYSKTGATETMARAVADGARSVAGTEVLLKTIESVKEADLMTADAIVLGSPVYNGGPAAAVKAFMEGWPFGRLKEKVGAAFCTAGGTSAGEELCMTSLLTSMLVFQFVVVGGDSWQASFGASAITEEGRPADKQGVDDAAKAKAGGLGARVARVAAQIKAGRAAVAKPPAGSIP